MNTETLEEMPTEGIVAIIMADLETKEEHRNCGRVVCGWCKPVRDMGPAVGLARGKVTHGICPTCSAAMIAEADAL